MTDEGAYFVWEDWETIGDENIRPNDGILDVKAQGPDLCSFKNKQSYLCAAFS